MRYKIWNKQETLVTPIGEVLTPSEVIEKYPMAAIEGMKFIICDAPINLGVFMEFTQTKEQYKEMGADITDDMADQEGLDAITFFEENPPEPEPTAEERMASAMEFQAMMTIPTEVE